MEPTHATSTEEIDEIELMERELELTLTEEPKEKAGAKPDKSEAPHKVAGEETPKPNLLDFIEIDGKK